jgi:hypothetical protein
MPMVIRRGIRCGVQVGPFFNGRWRDKFFSRQGTKECGVPT